MKISKPATSAKGNVEESFTQGISATNLSRATYILKDKIYTDKAKAAYYETLCNAIDEHRKHNIKENVQVILTDSELIIRDKAKGLSAEDLQYVFFQYFESTKDSDNEQIGGFGIGAKAPGAYADTYYVESFYNGEHSIYISAANGFSTEVSKVFTGTCDISETGICVRIPLNSFEDHDIFMRYILDSIRMIGFNSDAPEIDVYIIRSECDYFDIYTDQEKYLSDSNKLKIPENYYFRNHLENSRLSVDNEVLILKTGIGYDNQQAIQNSLRDFDMSVWNVDRLLCSPFFRTHNHWAYDGDMLYKINIDLSSINNSGIDTYELNNRLIIFTFNRGELPLTPSRESIDLTDISKAWIEEKCGMIQDKIIQLFNDVYNTEFDSGEHYEIVKERVRNNDIFRCINGTVFNYINDDMSDIVNQYRTSDRNGLDHDSFSSISLNRNYTNYTNFPKTIFIDYDIDKKYNYRVIFHLLKKGIIGINGQQYYDKFKNYTFAYAFIRGEKERKKFYSDFVTQTHEKTLSPRHGQVIFRENIEYYKMSDIIKFDDGSRPEPLNKTTTVSNAGRCIDIYTSKDIEIEECGDYYYLSYRENQSNDYHQLTDGYSRRGELLNGKKIAMVYQSSIAKFAENGGIHISKVNIEQLSLDYFTKHDISFLNRSLASYVNRYEIDKSIFTENLIQFEKSQYLSFYSDCIPSVYRFSGLENIIMDFVAIQLDVFRKKIAELSEEEKFMISIAPYTLPVVRPIVDDLEVNDSEFVKELNNYVANEYNESIKKLEKSKEIITNILSSLDLSFKDYLKQEIDKL